MRTARWPALAAVAAIGLAHLAAGERQHRQRLRLDGARLHQQLLADQITHPELAVLWGRLSDLGEDGHRLDVHREQWIRLREALFSTRCLTEAGLRTAARAFFAAPANQQWWDRVREDRAEMATERAARRFHCLLDTGYQDESGTL
ncbi:DUF6082 family protein [Streptomyces sp. NPDC050085]|uniref:DUF6082 family protein n=1 Tax=Streptomyces sp. NPDC050085 TaxID=3365600 RepID=UPI0037B3CCC0